jgi:hypothetical protein
MRLSEVQMKEACAGGSAGARVSCTVIGRVVYIAAPGLWCGGAVGGSLGARVWEITKMRVQVVVSGGALGLSWSRVYRLTAFRDSIFVSSHLVSSAGSSGNRIPGGPGPA